MSYIAVAIAAYFLLAFSQTLDKFLLSERIPRPSVYAFYVALLSLMSLFLIPWGFHWQNLTLFSASIISGILSIHALVFFYRAVKENEISRVAPLIGSIVIMATVFISTIFLKESFSSANLAGVFFLLAGGFLVSFDFPVRSLKIFKGFYNSLASGILSAAAYLIFKYVYDNNTFINGFIWTRMGMVLGGLSLLTIPVFKKEIFASFQNFGSDKKKNSTSIVLFFINKTIAGGYSVLLNYAFFLGSVVVVNALVSAQFVFVFLLASAASIKYPKMFGEKLFFWDWAQKAGAIILIGTGIVLVSI